MPGRRRTDPTLGRAALDSWCADPSVPRAVVRTAVRFTLEEFAARVPGGAVEIRVPPDGAIQAVPGPGHTRGTPPNVVQTDPVTWLRLVTGRLDWSEAVRSGRLSASGQRADLGAWLPLDPTTG